MNLIKKNISLIIVLVVFCVIAILLSSLKDETNLSEPAGDVGEAVINYIVSHGGEAELIDITEESGVYSLKLLVGGIEYLSYATKDGKLLFVEGINIEDDGIDNTSASKDTSANDVVSDYSDAQIEALAKCLTDNDAKFYGSFNCGWCNKEKQDFGEAVQYLTYIECTDEETGGQSQACIDAEIFSYPTWVLNGEKSPGYKTLDVLDQLSGCLVLSN